MKRCSVSYIDSSGIRHTVELSANSLYEAAAGGLEVLRKAEWKGLPPSQTQLEVLTPSGRHTIALEHLRKWCERSGRSPREIILKNRLKEALRQPC